MRATGHVHSDACGVVEHLIRPSVPAMESPRIHGILAAQIGQILIAVALLKRYPVINARHDLQQRANRINDVLLRLGAAPRQIDHLGIGAFGALGAGGLKRVHALEHQRRHGQERKHYQPRAYAQDALRHLTAW